MAKITTHITLDVSKRSRLQAIAAKQYDRNSRYINVRLTNQGDFINIPLGSLVTINAERPDFQSKSFAGEVNADGTVTVRITYWMLELEGIVSCDISVEDAQSVKLSSLNFTIEVEHANYSGTEISDDDPQYDVFIQVLAGEADRVAAENERKANETERKTSEAARAQAETTRQTNESTRQDNEAIRITNENARIAEEQNRAQAEKARAQEFSTWEKQIDTIDSRSIRNSKRITNLEQGLPSEQFMTDSTMAHVKDVPVNALPFAEVSKVGGMTRKCTNLIPYPYELPTANSGTTFAINHDLSIDVSGTPTSSIYMTMATLTLDTGTYTLHNYSSLNNDVKLYVTYGDATTLFANTSFTLSEKTSVRIRIAVYNTFDGNTVRVIPMLNKGSTALPYEPYYEGLRDAKVTEIESVGKNFAVSTENPSQTNFGITITRIIGASFAVVNGTLTEAYALRLFGYFKLPAGTYTASVFNINPTDRIYVGKGSNILVNYIQLNSPKTFTLTEEAECFIQIVFEKGSAYNNTEIQVQIERGDTATEYSPYTRNSLPIPEAVQTLDGYGWGINADCYNYIDWEKKQFVKRVGVVDLGTLNWTYKTIFTTTVSGRKVGKGNLICSKYSNATASGTSLMNDGEILGNSVVESVYVKDSNYTDATAFKTAMSGVMLYYELATPEVTDISDLLSADNFLAVEGGGTVTAVNEYGYDVPSEIEYQLEV